MQVGVDVKCMHTNFGGCGYSSFEGIATFKFSQISLSNLGYINIEGAKPGRTWACSNLH